ncbi:MAG: sigma-54 dependent transcriptional regulator [Brevundimonas sp.]|jgi:two-component system response regulator FlrC|uniref:sigma-54-dependent transcriptional regulator FlbD n=1 Tax=Brevundimonas sp. TaxID=1871086 RepID=UPI00271C5C78|nr:sigma-54 dependent transcriptional regulator [Brevundimonas sp.]MDO9608055.1 sigma-54 dependent transcriptional regulator [Brevundimonas sp.]
MRLLVVGRLSGQLASAVKMAMAHGAKVSHVERADQATEQLRRGQGADLLMVDYQLDIAALIAANEAERITVPVVAFGVDADAREAAAAIKAGAKEFIPLPPDAELIAAVLAAVADDEKPMISADPSMKAVLQLADQVARSEASILITGESGVGKEVMARYMHDNSRRSERPFISVNCAAIPDNLLESELFGHEKGAFTGAVARRIGKFEEADGGTLLLDEISEMDARLQAKLLRAIQERIIDRVGGSKPVPVNIRIIATSNRDLARAVSEGTFREDLLYRLNVVNLRLPSLRERPGDISVLAEHFIKKYAAANGVPVRPMSARAHQAIIAHRWPGNVRELENAMHRAVLLATGPEIDVDAIRLPDGQPLTPASGMMGSASTGHENPYGGGVAARAAQAADAVTRSFVGQTVAAMEKTLILDTLTHCLGNRTHAANILGISIRTLRNKLNEYADEGTAIPAPQSGVSASGYAA